MSNPEEYVYSNQLGFFNVLNFCKNRKNKINIRFFKFSLWRIQKFPTKEWQGLNPKNIYSATKLGNEIFAEIYSKFYDLNIIGLRFSLYTESGEGQICLY